MTPDAPRTYRTTAFAALAGVTPRALRHYDRPDAQLIRQLIEVMHMDQHREDTINGYATLLMARGASLASLSDAQRIASRDQWTTLIADIRNASNADPASPQAQALLDRWMARLQELRGPLPAGSPAPDVNLACRPMPDLREEIWARRSKWLPLDAAEQAAGIGSSEEALAKVRAIAETVLGSDVMDFITRARAARG
jgi:hypothetical protein